MYSSGLMKVLAKRDNHSFVDHALFQYKLLPEKLGKGISSAFTVRQVKTEEPCALQSIVIKS